MLPLLDTIMAIPKTKICTQFAHILPFSPQNQPKTVFFEEKLSALKNPVRP
jgi:hypothetical protein